MTDDKSTVYVVTEAWGGTAVAEVYETWDLAIAYARQRFENYVGRCDTAQEVNEQCGHATFAATWDPVTPGTVCRVDIAVWERKVRNA